MIDDKSLLTTVHGKASSFMFISSFDLTCSFFLSFFLSFVHGEGRPHGVEANFLDCRIEVSEFELQSRYYV